ncbi:MAG: hypothetical protein Q4F05_02495 [bacterium]|nr:hypothetical protein [bacterium]
MKLNLDNTLLFTERKAFIFEIESAGKKLTHANLDTLATYLLNSPDVERDKSFRNDTSYNLDDSLKNKKKNSGVDLDIINGSMIMDTRNRYVNYDWKVTTSDLNAPNYMGTILRQYEQLKQYYNKQYESKAITLFKYKYLASEIAKDMLEVKKQLMGYTEKPHRNSYIGETIDWSFLDYSNEQHVQALINNIALESEIIPNDTLTLIALDIRVAIEKLEQQGVLSKSEVELLYKINQGYTLKELEGEFHIQFSGIRKRYLKVCKKIALYYGEKVVDYRKKVSKVGQKLAS